jgi:hypothetical protein
MHAACEGPADLTQSAGSQENVPATHEAEPWRPARLCRRTEAMIPSCGRTRHRASYSDRLNGGIIRRLREGGGDLFVAS